MAKRRARRKPPEIRRDMPPPQVGWLTNVSVLEVAPDRVRLGRPGVAATVAQDGTFDLAFRSDSLAADFLMKDLTRTDEILKRHALSLSEAEWLERLEHWAEPPPIISFRGGTTVTEWPGTGSVPPRRLGEFGVVPDTQGWNDPFFKGERFRFAHFKTAQGEEGAVIQWFDPRRGAFEPPAVYLGDVAGWIAAQTLYAPGTPEEWLEINEVFDNVFMWALEQMGSFDRPGILAPEVLEAITQDPEILLTESLSKILGNLENWPAEFQEEILATAAARGLA